METSDLNPARRKPPRFRRRSPSATPAEDVSETDKAYEIAAELPGMDEKNLEVKFADVVLTIKGERQEEREEKEKGYHLRERSFGFFQRAFPDAWVRFAGPKAAGWMC